MKYMKMLGLLAVAAAALMAFAGTASATVTYNGAAYGGEIVATSSNTTLHGSVTIECKKSEVKGSITAGATSGTITTLTFGECGPDTVTVVDSKEKATAHGGTLSVSNIAGTTEADVRSTGARVTVVVHRTVLGFPVTSHCIYATNNTDIGNLTQHTDVLDIGSSPIPRITTDGSCGETSVWTGSYTITKPGVITVD
jgi:hypothetical protein